MGTRAFWLAAAERLVGAVLVSLATAAADAGNVLAMDWPNALGVAGALALASLASSAGKAQIPLGDLGAPTLVPTGKHARPE